jgi:AcrR family transcriptional regulator
VEQIGQAALKLFLERGVADVTVDDVVIEAGIAKGSFYRYFESMEDVVDALLHPLRELMLRALGAATAGIAAAEPAQLANPYLALAASVSEAVITHAALFRLFLQEARGPAVGARRPIRLLADEVTRRGVELALEGRRRGWFRSTDPRVATLIIIGAAERLIFEHLCTGGFADPAEISSALVSTIIDGVRKR